MDRTTLQNHALLRGASPDAISATIRANLVEHRCLPQGDPVHTNSYFHHVSLGSTMLANVEYGTEVFIDGSSKRENYYILLPLSGKFSVNFGGASRVIDSTSAVVINPWQAVNFHIDADCGKLIVRFKHDALHRHLINFLGRTVARPIEFEPFLKLDQARVGSLVRTLEHICGELDDPFGIFHTTTLAGRFESLLAETLLSAVPNVYSSQVRDATRNDGPESLLRVEHYIHANLARDISLADLVLASRTSERSLYMIFKAYRNTTPMGYLKVRRLQEARRELECSHHKTLSVADIAVAVGFTHLGNFAADYRRLFGELPSETLRRKPWG